MKFAMECRHGGKDSEDSERVRLERFERVVLLASAVPVILYSGSLPTLGQRLLVDLLDPMIRSVRAVRKSGDASSAGK